MSAKNRVTVSLASLSALLLLASAAPSMAFGLHAPGTPDTGTVNAEVGVRYWLGYGTDAKTLKDLNGNTVSKLTYGSELSNAAELYGSLSEDYLFIRGYAGIGLSSGGNLQDEDFPPTISPYSSTTSTEKDATLGYATVDVGGYFYKDAGSKVGGFVGYNYLNRDASAYGCQETATNSTVCNPTVPDSVDVITQNDNWQSLRIGLTGELALPDRFVLSAEGAVLPYVVMNGNDNHRLRTDLSGPIPEDGQGWGVQLQTMLDYQLTPTISVGAGARYWHMQSTGTAHFEAVSTGGSAQPEDWSTDVFGGLLEVKAKF